MADKVSFLFSLTPALVLSERSRGSREETMMNNDNASGYSDQDWNLIQLEITRRVQQRMAANRTLGYQEAYEAVMQADPSLAAKDWNAIQVEITQRVKRLQAVNNQLNYANALQAVMNDDPNLVRQWRAARAREFGGSTIRQIDPALGEVDLEIQPLVQEAIAASGGHMDYGAAYKAVLSARPDLKRRKVAALGLRGR